MTSADIKKGVPSSGNSPDSKKQEADQSSEAFVDKILKEVDASLGLIDKNDESFDLSTAQFWFKAAYQKDLESLFSEKTRLKILIDELKSRKFSEEDIQNLFVRVKQARLAKKAEEAQLELEKAKVKRKIYIAIGAIVVVFFVLLFFSLKRRQAELELAKAIANAKILRLASAENISYRRGKNDTEFSVIPIRQPEIYEGDFVRTTIGTNTIELPGNGRLNIMPESEFKINKVEISPPPEFKQILLRLSLEKGGLSWKKPENCKMTWQLAFPGGEVEVKWGEGFMKIDGEKRRVTVLEGENYLWLPGKLPVPLNGLMEAIFNASEPAVIQMME